jgi:gliding motility-associated-like protein
MLVLRRALSCLFSIAMLQVSTSYSQTIADFTIPASVCVNTPVNITNTSQNATSYYWNFCVADINQTPIGTNLGNPGGNLASPVFMDYVQYNGNYYAFVNNFQPGSLVRLDYGNSLLNTPVSTNLGNFGGLISGSFGMEGIQVVENEGRWYAIIVGGSGPAGISPRVVKIDFGPNLTNPTPVATNWGNIGTLNSPHDLHVFKENNNWYGLTVNADNNTVTRFDFTNSFNNTPTGVNLGGFGLLGYPDGIFAINDNGFWRVFVTSNNSNSRLVRLDFGTSLLNTPSAVDLGSVGNTNGLRDLTLIKYCDQVVGFGINGTNHSLYRLNFPSLSGAPTVTNLGNVGNLQIPHSISKLFRVNEDLYTFITNVGNHTITRLRFPGCTNSSATNSTAQQPAPITYSAPGIYNINLTIDDGLPTQASICRQITVLSCQDSLIVNDYTPVLSVDSCNNIVTVEDAAKYNTGDTVLLIQMKGAMIDSANTFAFGNISSYRNAGNYEFNYVKGKTGNKIELLNSTTRSYDAENGAVQLIRVPYYQNFETNRVLTCLPWDGRKGGVLAMNVMSTLSMKANIAVSGKGFRGGQAVSNGIVACNLLSYITPDNTGSIAARKGEGIFNTNTLLSGSGKLANGGGGGNNTNSGGGGGANAGAGGVGGNQASSCGPVNYPNGGLPGAGLIYAPAINKIFMGGGGGAGHQNDVPALGSGGNGGGLILLSCTNLLSNGYDIHADGATPQHLTGTNDDGRSGGGGGGTVLLNYSVSDVLHVYAKGGNGDYPELSTAFHGPGGGGGGGALWINKPTVPSDLLWNTGGGANGTNINIGNSAWGALPGNPGAVYHDLVLQYATAPFTQNITALSIDQQALSCTNFNFEGSATVNTSPVTSWQWNFGEGGSASVQQTQYNYSQTGDYTVKLIVTDGSGCRDSTTVEVKPLALNFDFNYKLDVCNPLTVAFEGVGLSANSPYWSFGNGNITSGVLNVTEAYPVAGDYLVRYSVSEGICTDTLDKVIHIGVVEEDIVLTADTTICYGTTKQLRTASALSFCWSPATFLDNPFSPQPVTSATQDITYYFTAEIMGNNMIVNGDFSQGNTWFSSQYIFANPNTTEGQYHIGTNPRTWNGGMSSCGDHTSGSGNMMMVNGSPVANATVWRQTLQVLPNTQYAFATWIQALVANNPAQLQFTINGKEIGLPIMASLPACTWNRFYANWNSGNNSTAEIAIINKNTILAGNDFALDDISFAEVLIKRDSVKIMVEKPLVTTNADTIVCTAKPVQLFANGAQTYSWLPNNALTNAAIDNPVASPLVSTEYIVTGTTLNGCIAKDTVQVNVFAKPIISILNDTAICKNTFLPLWVNGGVSYSWSPALSVNDPSSASPVASPAASTLYQVVITDINTCEYVDSVKIDIRPDPVFAVSSDDEICLRNTITLHASGGDIYTWLPATGLDNNNGASVVASPAATTDYTVTIQETTCGNTTTLATRVTVLPLPAVNASRSNDIDCSYDRSQLNASGARTYNWTPAATLNNPRVGNPVAMPAVTTSYIVAGTDRNGCTGYDTIVVKVENINKGGYLMPSAFTPNNDGLNDCYGVKYWGIVEEIEFSIFNRWGERVFFTKERDKCWDGTYKGEKLGPGVFVYMISAKTNCETPVFRKGTFVLIR